MDEPSLERVDIDMMALARPDAFDQDVVGSRNARPALLDSEYGFDGIHLRTTE